MRCFVLDSSIVRIVGIVVLILIVSSCVGGKGGDGGSSPGASKRSTLCGTQASSVQEPPSISLLGVGDIQQSSTQASSQDDLFGYGDGSNGEFYLASNDTFYFGEKTYNYTNFYLESGSTLAVQDDVAAGAGEITINSLGSCYLLGDIDFNEYQGTLYINCYGELHIEGAVDMPNGNLVLSAGSLAIVSDGASAIPLPGTGDSSVTLTSDLSDTLISFDTSTLKLEGSLLSTTLYSTPLETVDCQ